MNFGSDTARGSNNQTAQRFLFYRIARFECSEQHYPSRDPPDFLNLLIAIIDSSYESFIAVYSNIFAFCSSID